MAPRVPLVEPDLDDPVTKAMYERRGGWLATVDRVLLHSPPVAEGWNTFFAAIREGTTVSPRLRELAMLRVAHLNGDHHNWWHHEPLARDAGLSDAEIDAVRDRGTATTLSDLDRAVLAYATSVTRDVTVADEVFADVRDELTTRQVVELTAIVAAYNLVSRFLVGMGIDREV